MALKMNTQLNTVSKLNKQPVFNLLFQSLLGHNRILNKQHLELSMENAQIEGYSKTYNINILNELFFSPTYQL